MADPKTVAYYLRLSRTDGDLGENGKKESNSIENQRMLLEEYQSRSVDLGGDPRIRYDPDNFDLPHQEYVDDGYTGTNFERPAFQELLENCRKGKISTILVKDMSRLGRNYIETGDYIEQIFPMLGIRFIAVNECYDTGKTDDLDFGIAVENLINTLYVKDCAKKARAARRTKWKKGILTSKKSPLGYFCDDLKEGWKIDEGGAEIVRLIFAEAVKGYDTGMIANILNEKGIPTPYVYLKSIGRRNGAKKLVAPDGELLWNASMVWRILRNEAYIGTLVQGKKESVILGGKQVKGVRDEDRYKTENAHEAIIDAETFRKAQMVIRYNQSAGCRTNRSYALKGVVRCGHCKRVMNLEYGAYGDNMHCTWRRINKSGCSRESYPYNELERVVLVSIRQMGKLCGDLLTRMAAKKEEYDVKTDRNRIKEIDARRIRIYEEYADGVITGAQFKAEKEQLVEEKEALERKIVDVGVMADHQKEVKEKLIYLKDAGKAAEELQTLTRKMVSDLIKTVYVFDKDHIEVVFKYEDAIREAIEECDLEVKLSA